MKKLSSLVFLLAIASGAHAAGSVPTQGRWICNSCDLPAPETPGDSFDLTMTMVFLKGTVNQSVKIWRPNDTVLICDGSACQMLMYQASGNFTPVGASISDTGQGYKNGQITKKTSQNSDSGVPIGSFYVYVSMFSYYNTTQQLLTPKVIVTQGNQTSTGLGSNFAGGFAWGGGDTSYSYGGDTLAGGGDLYAADYSGGGKACRPPCQIWPE